MIVYVAEGTPPVPDSTLHTCLNQIRNQYGNFALRVDPGNAEAARAARRWAVPRRIPVQHHGMPAAIIMPGHPDAGPILPQQRAIRNRAASNSGASMLARTLIQLLSPATVIWLGTPSEEPPATPLPDKPPPPPHPPY